MPWLALAVLIYVAGIISDRLTVHHSTGYVRKLIMSLCKMTTCHFRLVPIGCISFSFHCHCAGFTGRYSRKRQSPHADHHRHHRRHWQLRTSLGELWRQSSGHRRTLCRHSDGVIQRCGIDAGISRTDANGLCCRRYTRKTPLVGSH